MHVTRALLFTDIVDSTRLTQSLGEQAAARFWAAHDRICYELLASWRGRLIDKTDGIFALFESPADAVGFASAYHEGLAALRTPFKARVGIHVGPVSIREAATPELAHGSKHLEVDGLAKPTAARVMSVALGKQTLVTRDAIDALGKTALRIECHGHWHLQGIEEPIELYELGHAGSAFLPPADGEKAYRVVARDGLWVPVRSIKHTLPAESDSFVGRSSELQLLADRIRGGARLVSILGTGGCGKTRLATRFGWTWLGEYPGGVWFCDLSRARDVDGIVLAVARALDLRLGRSDPVEQLADAIAGRGRCLIVLDNVEQVSRHAPQVFERWSRRAAQARFVATTREVMGLPGEVIVALAPLPTHAAAELFLQRASSAVPGFRTTGEDADVVNRLVTLLDGLPLAIELAAARVRVLTPASLLSRMSERFKLLSSRGGRQDRQATLRATIDWSWELLSFAERMMLPQLSVFVGGFTIDAVERVVDLSVDPSGPWVLDVLHALVDKSLVRKVAADRFDMLESIREYAAEKLSTVAIEGGATQAETERRHARHFAALGPDRAVEHSCIELGNLVAACRHATAHGEVDTATQALAGAWSALKLRGPFQVGIELSSAVTSIEKVEPSPTATLIKGRALLAGGMINEARTCLEQAARLAGEQRDSAVACAALTGLAEVLAHEGQIEESLRCYEAILDDARSSGPPALEWDVLSGIGICHEYLGRLDDAEQSYAASLAVAQRLDNVRLIGGALGNLGQLDANRGRMARAREHYQRALEIALQLGDRQWEGTVRCNLGLLHHSEGRHAEARRELECSLSAARELGHARLEAVVLCNLGIVFEAAGEAPLAEKHFERAIKVAQDLKDRRSEGQFLGYLGLLVARRARFDEARDLMDRAGRLLREVGDTISLGLLHCQHAQTQLLAGNPPRARELLRDAESIAAEVAPDARSEFGQALERVRLLVDSLR